MILLKGHTLEKKSWFAPETMALNLEERNSTATLTCGPEAPEISVGDWLQDDTDPGKGIVWRVKTVNDAVETATRTITLEHVINTLKDIVMFGEVTPQMITGVKTDRCTARQAAVYIMGKQGEWRLGNLEENPENPYSFNGETLWAALETITGSLEDVQWEYNLNSMPFTLHIRKIPEEFSSEMRMSRNITTMRRQIDLSRTYTRFYPIGKNNIHIDGDYLSKNERLWGIRCKVETDQSQDTKEKLKNWARERLNRHCDPLVTITISGLDLSRSTGEPLDKIQVGRKCRVPLPEKGITLTERVTKLSWSDKIKEPEKFTATLANLQEDVASIINSMQKASGGGGKAAAKEAEEDHAWFVDTTTHVGMVAEAVAGAGADKDWSRVSEIIADGTGLHGRVTKTEDDVIAQETRIEANEEAIRLEAEKRISQDESLLGKLNVEAGKVGMVVGTKNGQNFIKAAEICVAINDDGSSQAVIEADKIHLLGETIAKKITADYISTKVGELTVLKVKSIGVSGGASFSGAVTCAGTINAKNLILDDVSVGAAVWNIRLQRDGDTYKLQKQTVLGSGWVDVGTFSRATALDGSWSGGVLTVTATPQGKTFTTAVEGGTESWSGGIGTIPIRYTKNGGASYYNTGAYAYAHVNKGDIGATRGNRQTTQPSADATLTTVVANGYYVITVNVHGESKTFRLFVDVPA